MKNCLKTQLKSVVDNDNLNKLGIAKIKVIQVETPSQDTQYLKLRFKEPGTLKSTGVGMKTAYDSGTVNYELPLLYNASTQDYVRTIWVTNDTGTIEISKYSLSELQSAKVFNKLIEFEDVRYSHLTQIITCYTGNISYIPETVTLINLNGNMYVSGDLSSISKCIGMTSINIGLADGIVGNIASLGTLVNLTNFQASANCYGTVESFVDAQRQNGRTTCDSISVPYLGSNKVTFNSQSCPNTSDLILSWTADTITLGDTTINA